MSVENLVKKYGSLRNYWLQKRYRITEADFDQMKAEQGGRCAICRRRDAEVVDHDHATGKVRGLLCQTCNRALGVFEPNLQELLDYVRRNHAVRL